MEDVELRRESADKSGVVQSKALNGSDKWNAYRILMERREYVGFIRVHDPYCTVTSCEEPVPWSNEDSYVVPNVRKRGEISARGRVARMGSEEPMRRGECAD